jgi:hypothetical protein
MLRSILVDAGVTVTTWLRIASRWFRDCYFVAFPPHELPGPLWQPIPPSDDVERPPGGRAPAAGALLEGALLYEVDGEPVSDKFIA